MEEHSEDWLTKTVRYLTDCNSLKQAAIHGLIETPTFKDPPPMLPIPQYTIILSHILLELPLLITFHKMFSFWSNLSLQVVFD